jgi:hypothetical protein
VKYFGLPAIKAAVDSKDWLNVISIASSLQEAYYFFNKLDSAYLYSRMVNEYNDTVYYHRNMAVIQNAIFNRQIKENELAFQKEMEEEERKNWIQVMIIAISIIILVVSFIIFSHSVFASASLIKFLGIINLLIVFEFLNLLADPFLIEITHHSPLLMLLLMVLLASILGPLHHKIEHWITNHLVEKNNRLKSFKSSKSKK